MSNRDDQFGQWARAAFGTMLKAAESHMHGDAVDMGSEDAQRAMLQALACAAYDLVSHTLNYGDGDIDVIPDMPVLPEEENV